MQSKLTVHRSGTFFTGMSAGIDLELRLTHNEYEELRLWVEGLVDLGSLEDLPQATQKLIHHLGFIGRPAAPPAKEDDSDA